MSVRQRRAQAVRAYDYEEPPAEWASFAAAVILLAVALGVAVGVIVVFAPRLAGLVGRMGL